MYLDANFFIIANFSQDEKGKNARHIFQEIVKGKKAITSSLALDEVMWVIIKNKKVGELRGVIEGIYKTKNLEVKEVSPLIPLQALSIMENCGLRPRDAFHVSIMDQFHTNEIVSDDADFDKIQGIKRIKL